jgi:hypothetical protein
MGGPRVRRAALAGGARRLGWCRGGAVLQGRVCWEWPEVLAVLKGRERRGAALRCALRLLPAPGVAVPRFGGRQVRVCAASAPSTAGCAPIGPLRLPPARRARRGEARPVPLIKRGVRQEGSARGRDEWPRVVRRGDVCLCAGPTAGIPLAAPREEVTQEQLTLVFPGLGVHGLGVCEPRGHVGRCRAAQRRPDWAAPLQPCGLRRLVRRRALQRAPRCAARLGSRRCSAGKS